MQRHLDAACRECNDGRLPSGQVVEEPEEREVLHARADVDAHHGHNEADVRHGQQGDHLGHLVIHTCFQ